MVMTLPELASYLRITEAIAARLVDETDMPRVSIAGKVRFQQPAVDSWLAGLRADPLAVIEQPPPTELRPGPASDALPPAGPDAQPWVTAEALAALAHGATEASQNMARLTLRDALLSLNDGVLTKLTQASRGRLRLHPEEAHRTSPWRLEDSSDGVIDAIRLAWGEGPGAPSGFADRARLVVELSACHLTVALEGPGGGPVNEDAESADRGYALVSRPSGWALSKSVELPSPAPTLARVVAFVSRELDHLAPRWASYALRSV